MLSTIIVIILSAILTQPLVNHIQTFLPYKYETSRMLNNITVNTCKTSVVYDHFVELNTTVDYDSIQKSSDEGVYYIIRAEKKSIFGITSTSSLLHRNHKMIEFQPIHDSSNKPQLSSFTGVSSNVRIFLAVCNHKAQYCKQRYIQDVRLSVQQTIIDKIRIYANRRIFVFFSECVYQRNPFVCFWFI